MKSTWHWTLSLATIACTIALLGVAAIGIRSYWRGDQIIRVFTKPKGKAQYFYDTMIVIWNGNIHLHHHGGYYPPESPPRSQTPDLFAWNVFDHDLGLHARVVIEPPETLLERFNFMWHRYSGSGNAETYVQWEIGTPLWAVELILVAPFILLLRKRKRHLRAVRRSQGLCVSCGYDLRASPQRCPECGLETAEASS